MSDFNKLTPTDRLLNLVPLHSSGKCTWNAVRELDPLFRSSVIEMLEAMPSYYVDKLTIGKAYRSREEQEKLYDRYLRGGPLAAKPGHSMHEDGLAIDFWPVHGRSSDYDNFEFRKAVHWIWKHGPAYGVHGLSKRNMWGEWEQDPRDIVHFQDGEPNDPGALPPKPEKKSWFGQLFRRFF